MRRSPTQPPRPLDRMVGREADLDALEAEVRRSRLVTVQGPPGVGKTRLAMELAYRLMMQARPVAVCDVTECATAGDVIVRVATALGVATHGVDERLAARPMTLVIDNAEHLTSEVAACLEPWLAVAPELAIVVTTRIRLRVAGEVVFDLSPLDEAAGTELFVERARALRRETGGDDAAIAELVRTLDGMPLAIELAAARARLYEPAQLLERIGHNLELLHVPDGRSRSLAAALQLSFDLLSPAEQQALAQASVFRGGFSVEAAEAVIDLDGKSVVEALEALVDHSLVWTRRVGGRRRLGLYLVVRDFAAAHLADPAAVRARHTAFFLRASAEWSDELIGPNGPAAIVKIAAEAENLMAIHRRALADPGRGGDALGAAHALHPLYVTRGPIDHSIAIVEQALAVAPLDHPRRLSALEYVANAMRDTRLGDAADAYDELEQTALALGSRMYVGRAYAGKGIVKFLQRDESGEVEVEAALAIQREVDDRFGESISLASLGHLALYRNDLAVARELFGRALSLVVEIGDPRNEGIHLGNLGRVEQECGRLDVARSAFERAREMFRAMEDRRSDAWALSMLACVVQEQGLLDEARLMYRETLVRNEEVGNRRAQGVALAQLARIEQWEGAYEAAHALYRQALAALDASGWTTRHALVTAELGSVLADLGLLDEARRAFDRAEDALRVAGDHAGQAALEVARGHLDLATGKSAAARRRLVEALANIDRWNVRFARIGLERALSRAGDLGEVDTDPNNALVIGPQGRWFRAPGGAKVDLGRRRQLRLILSLLGIERRERPKRALTVDALLAGGWPGEAVLPEAGASRVYVAISTLRRMGLRDLLQRVDDGYLIDPDAAVIAHDGD